MERASQSAVPSLNKGRYLIWVLLYAPIATQTYRYLDGAVFYGEYLHWTGVWATRLLMVTLAVTPLRRLFPNKRWTALLQKRRRDLGVATFLYALLHAIAYLVYKKSVPVILEEGIGFGMLTGWLAMLIFLPLAATSNDFAVRRLKRGWKTLHRIIYAGAVLTFAHWVGTAFDPTAGYVHLGLLALLMIPRWWQPHARSR